MNYSELSLNELFNLAKKSINNVHRNILEEDYKNATDIENEDKRKILMYIAYDRTCMYIATNALGITFYKMSLQSIKDSKDRKSLVKIIEICKELTYSTVRKAWHESLKEIFYQQKEQKQKSEKLSRICMIARSQNQNSFIRLINGEVTFTNNLSEATEFIATDDSTLELSSMSQRLESLCELSRDSIKVFFNPKMIGRTISTF